MFCYKAVGEKTKHHKATREETMKPGFNTRRTICHNKAVASQKPGNIF